jgi:ubiquinone/menaquinone biosynthesis C-methylase UbiE
MKEAIYIHGTEQSEQDRLRLLNRLTNRPFIEYLNIERPCKVLDVGCGLGILANEIAELYSNCEIFGVEYSKDQLHQADQSKNNIHFQQGDAHALPFEDSTFDVVYCRYLLEHVKNPVQVLKEMHRVVKPTGQVFTQENNIEITVYDPDCPKWNDIWQRFIDLQTQLGGDGLIGKKLYRLMKEAGFNQVELSIAPQVHGYENVYFYDWITNIIGNAESARDKLINYKIATDKEITAGIQELEALRSNPMASTVFYWNRAKGVKSLVN